MKRLAVLLLCCVAAGSCWGFAPPSPEDKGSTSATAVLQLEEQIASIVDRDKADCDMMAADLNKFFDQNSARLKALKEEGSHMTEQQRKEWEKKYGQRSHAAMEKIQGGMQGCYKNAKVKAAFDRMK